MAKKKNKSEEPIKLFACDRTALREALNRLVVKSTAVNPAPVTVHSGGGSILLDRFQETTGIRTEVKSRTSTVFDSFNMPYQTLKRACTHGQSGTVYLEVLPRDVSDPDTANSFARVECGGYSERTMITPTLPDQEHFGPATRADNPWVTCTDAKELVARVVSASEFTTKPGKWSDTSPLCQVYLEFNLTDETKQLADVVVYATDGQTALHLGKGLEESARYGAHIDSRKILVVIPVATAKLFKRVFKNSANQIKLMKAGYSQWWRVESGTTVLTFREPGPRRYVPDVLKMIDTANANANWAVRTSSREFQWATGALRGLDQHFSIQFRPCGVLVLEGFQEPGEEVTTSATRIAAMNEGTSVLLNGKLAGVYKSEMFAGISAIGSGEWALQGRACRNLSELSTVLTVEGPKGYLAVMSQLTKGQ